MSDNVFLSYGKKGDHVYHISKVANGLACGCYCPNCGARLVARHGTIRAWSFAHYDAKECDLRIAGETALHLAAKQILCKSDNFVLPRAAAEVHASDKWGNPHSMRAENPESSVKLENVHLEESIAGLRPDILATISGHQLAIEIRVTHQVDSSKRRQFRSSHLPCIEIDLHDVRRDISIPELEEMVLLNTKRKTWIYNRWVNYQHQPLTDKLKIKILEYEKTTEEALQRRPVVASYRDDIEKGPQQDHNIGTCVFCGEKTMDWWRRDSNGRCGCNPCYRKGLIKHPEFKSG